MTKNDIVTSIACNTGFRKSTVEIIVENLIELIKEEVSDGKSVSFGGFGVFETKHRNARTGRNPHTKEAVPIPERYVPFFKPAKAFKDLVSK